MDLSCYRPSRPSMAAVLVMAQANWRTPPCSSHSLWMRRTPSPSTAKGVRWERLALSSHSSPSRLPGSPPEHPSEQTHSDPTQNSVQEKQGFSLGL